MSTFSTKRKRLEWSLAVMKHNKLTSFHFFCALGGRLVAFSHELVGGESVEVMKTVLSKESFICTAKEHMASYIKQEKSSDRA